MRYLIDSYDGWSNCAKNSLGISSGVVSIVSMILGVCGITIKDIFGQLSWIYLVLSAIGLYLIVWYIIYFLLKQLYKGNYSTRINNNELNIVVGDLFQQEGMKLIPFTDTFETQVDDKVISRRSLNGVYITNYVCDLNELKDVIDKSLENTTCQSLNTEEEQKRKLPLGSIITFQDYMLLAFSTLNERNEAHISRGDYEQCLCKMWASIRSNYNGRPINIPLIGGGITTIDSAVSKDPTDLLKCIICTLRSSGIQLNQPINIVLTESDFQRIDMDRIRGEFK